MDKQDPIADSAPVDRQVEDRNWRRLVAYLKRCVTLDTASGLIDLADKRWMALGLASETLISGVESSIPLVPEIAEMARQLRPGDVLQYGWPTFVAIDKKGVRRLAPLLVSELESPGAGDTHVHVGDDPHLNPSFLASDLFDDADIRAVEEIFNDGVPPGRPDLLALKLEQTISALGIESPGLDGARLCSALPKGEGLFNVAVLVRAQSSLMTQALLQELSILETRTDWRNTAAAHLFRAPLKDWNRPERATHPFIAPVALSDSQEQLTRRLCDAPLTVATGPPGTGKSQVVVASVANSWARAESTLLVSTNNAAVDVAVERAAEIALPALIRTGNKTFRDNLPALASQAISYARSSQLDEAVIRRDLANAIAERDKSLSDIALRSELNASLARHLDAAETAAIAIWGVRTAPVIVDLPSLALRVARTKRSWIFKKWRQRRALKAVTAERTATFEDLASWVDHRTSFASQRGELATLDEALGNIDLDEINQRWRLASELLTRARISEEIRRREQSISAFGTIRGGGSGLTHVIRQAMAGLRGWACTALSLKQNFPLEPGLFDHVIIDEASQCSLAVVLPAAYRAKRLTLVGDRYQLSPIVGLSEVLVRDIASACGLDHRDLVRKGLDYRGGSAFSAFAEATGADDVQLLEEHFRCHPLIARWFNESFYGGRLTVLTDVGRWPPGQRGLHWIDTDGTAERSSTSSTVNRREAALLVDQLDSLLDGQSSIGVVTPFSGQADLIRQLANRRFDSERLAASDFIVGTAHRFQGNERDVILFSTVIAPGVNPRTARWVEQQRNLLNVAVSRARRAIVVFGHPMTTSEFCPTLASLRTAAIEGPGASGAAWAIHSDSEARLLQSMHSAGLAPVLKPSEQGFELDFALVTPSVRLDVEVDGSQHRDERARQCRRDVARDRILERIGWKVVRYPSWRCMEEPDAVTREIVEIVTEDSRRPLRSDGE